MKKTTHEISRNDTILHTRRNLGGSKPHIPGSKRCITDVSEAERRPHHDITTTMLALLCLMASSEVLNSPALSCLETKKPLRHSLIKNRNWAQAKQSVNRVPTTCAKISALEYGFWRMWAELPSREQRKLQTSTRVMSRRSLRLSFSAKHQFGNLSTMVPFAESAAVARRRH